MTIKIVGLVGEPGTGKDTIADFAIEDYGARRIGFADKIYSAVLAMKPIAALGFHQSEEGKLMPSVVRVNDIVSERGWRKGKDEIVEVRELLQRMGTEVGRNLFGEDFWVNLALNTLRAYYQGSGGELERFVFTDLRFENEEGGLRSFANHNMADLLIIRLRRPGHGTVNAHASESNYDNIRCDVLIDNDGDLELLHDHVRIVIGNFFNGDK